MEDKQKCFCGCHDDDIKGCIQCDCHTPKSPREEFEEAVRQLWSTALDEETERRYGMLKHHPPSDCPAWFINEVSKIAARSHKTALE